MASDDTKPRYSATGSILARKLKVAVMLPGDDDREILVNHLKRMGFQAQTCWPPPEKVPAYADLIFLSCQPDSQDPCRFWEGIDTVPLIAVLTYESPVFVDYAVELGAQAIIATPIRASGLLPTITVCMQRFRESRRQLARIGKLEQKLKGVMQLAEAKTILMRMYNVNEAEAYETLRKQAMIKRITIEEISQSIIQANDIFSQATPR